ncbi:hypothetical protein KBB08_03700 [Candidatus Gracilibacteria bacterium]|nr:hypothetical protein [Candidatus Gracilibacteria bacterium]
MTSLRHTYSSLLHSVRFLWVTALSAIFLVIAIALNYRAGTYAFNNMSNGVSDLFLDYLPLVDVSVLFIDGAVVMALLILLLGFLYPQRLPSILHNIALLYSFRAIALTLTHLGPPLSVAPPVVLGDTITDRFVGGADYFFSGHTALPFIIALIFWDKPWVRTLFLLLTVTFGFSALLGHLHYSIDVFVAPFMSYCAFAICRHYWPISYRPTTGQSS